MHSCNMQYMHNWTMPLAGQLDVAELHVAEHCQKLRHISKVQHYQGHIYSSPHPLRADEVRAQKGAECCEGRGVRRAGVFLLNDLGQDHRHEGKEPRPTGLLLAVTCVTKGTASDHAWVLCHRCCSQSKCAYVTATRRGFVSCPMHSLPLKSFQVLQNCEKPQCQIMIHAAALVSAQYGQSYHAQVVHMTQSIPTGPEAMCIATFRFRACRAGTMLAGKTTD